MLNSGVFDYFFRPKNGDVMYTSAKFAKWFPRLKSGNPAESDKVGRNFLSFALRERSQNSRPAVKRLLQTESQS